MVFSYSHSRSKLEKLARNAGENARAGTPGEAAQDADVLLLAVHWNRVDDVLRQAGDLSGKVLVTCSLPMNDDDTELVVAHSSSGAEELAKRVPGARVVSAFNTVPSEVLYSVFEARGSSTPPSLVYCGDVADSKGVADGLIRDVGFDPVDADPLRTARYPSRSRCSLHDSRTRETAARNWRTGSSGSGSGDDAGLHGRRDDDQEVNVSFSKALPYQSPFQPREALAGRDARTLAREILAMDDNEFRSSFKGSPMKRVKLRGLKRNAAVVLRNVGDPGDVDVLTRALHDPEPLVREHATWALGRIGAPGVLDTLLPRATTDSRAQR